MAAATFNAVVLLSSLAIKQVASSPISPRTSHSRPCTSFTLPVPITVHQHEYDIVHVDSNIDAASFEIDMDTWDTIPFGERITKNITISKTYDIYATLCVPPNGSKKNFLQVATHGGGFDSRYWDAEVEPEKYSYVDAVLEAGYSIFTYDRLTTGKSAHPDAYTEGQLDAEVEIVRSITEIIRSGGLPKHCNNAINWTKIIHVGHSLGSFITYTLTSLYPTLSDAAVLTGLVPSNESTSVKVSSQDFQYAPEVDPELFSDSSSGYIVPGSKTSLQVGFFSSKVDKTSGLGGFDPNLLDYAWDIRQPITVTELGTGGLLLFNNPVAPGFKGPVQFMAGEYDFLICGGDCKGTFTQEILDTMYPMAKDVEVHLQPGTGHGLPFHYGAKTGFQATFDFLANNGL
jgi:pimeloyl-ACP methyl ester carboxylesterase